MRSFTPSVSQRLIWFDQQLSIGSSKYNIGGYACLDGELAYPFFNKALAALIGSQEAYTTIFREDHQSLLCLVADAVPEYEIDLIDLSEQEDPWQSALQWMENDFQSAFEVEGNYLFSFKLLKITRDRHLWYAKIHHLISDGWSFMLLMNQVAQLYDSLTHGKEPAITCYRYSDFAKEDEEYYRSPQALADRDFWLREFANIPPALFKRKLTSPLRGRHASSETVFLSAEKALLLRNFAERNKTSQFHVLLSVFLILFSRTRLQQEIVVGLPVLNRTKKVYRNTSGVFMNLLALQFSIDGMLTISGFCNLVKQKMSGALRHQRYQYGNLVKDLSLPYGSTLYDIRISYEDFDFSTGFGGLAAHATALSNHAEIDKLAIYLRDYHNEGFDIRFVYDETYFNQEDIRSLGESLQCIIGLLDDSQDVRIADVPVISPVEKKAVLTASCGDKQLNRKESFLEIWNHSVGIYTQRVAVSQTGRSMTYADLDARAKNICERLIHLRQEEERPVVLVLPRSSNMIAAMLGCMMAGVAYIPLDDNYPLHRVREIAVDAGCRLWLVGHETRGYRPEDSLSSVFDIDEWGAIPVESVGMLAVEGSEPVMTSGASVVSGTKPCYIIYTSGSTGKPKGVVISNRSLADYTGTVCGHFNLTELDVVLQQSSFSFDTSIEEIFPVLAVGGRLHILEDRKDLSALYLALDREGITILSTSPLVLRFLNDLSIPSSLRLLISGGDILKPSFINNLLNSHIPIFNTYGPTESTVCATYHRVGLNEDPIPIGRAIPNREIYILDNSMHLQPFGVEGEIFLAGDGLALGYLHDEKLTGEKFVNHPFDKDRKIYRTGDTGIMCRNGNVLFTGRKDEQISYRGYRIETYEVEKAIGEVIGLEDCHVTVRNYKEAPLLVAYIKLKGTVVFSSAGLKQLLRERLPQHMIPEVVIPIDEFPFLANGKIDRRSLPDVEPAMFGSSAAGRRMPGTWLEEKIAGIWQAVLGREQINIDDPFFEIGGHSLNVMQLINDYFREFEIKLSVRELFDHTTIADHASLISKKTTTAYHSIKPAEPALDHPVSGGQRRLWIVSQLEESSRAYHISGQMEFRGGLPLIHLELALLKLVTRHEILRTVFRENEQGELRQFILPIAEFPVKIKYLDIPGLNAGELSDLISKDTNMPFDLSVGPLWRSCLIKTAEDRYVFHYVTHHIISDGWSLELIKEEMLGYYQDSLSATRRDLPSLRIQYKDYAAWQNRQLEQGLLAEAAAYWHQQLASPLPVLDLPTDRMRPPVFSHKGERLQTIIDEELIEGLRKFCGENNGTVFMGCLCICNALLHRYSGSADIIVGTAVAGRDHAELKDQLGFYSNTLALRTRFELDETFEGLFAKVREMTLSAYEHQSYPFDRLIGELGIARDMSRSPLFDVMLMVQNYQPGLGAVMAGAELRNETIVQGGCFVKFDLGFEFLETPEGLCLRIEYNTDIFDRGTIVRLIGHYKRLLALATSQPQARIDSVDYLSPEERVEILDGYNPPEMKFPADKTIIDLFHEQVTNVPENSALVSGEKVMTYRELDHKSEYVGNYLRQLGVHRETLVPVFLERSPEMIIAILGILKAGGAYVPIDPDYPAERIGFILADIGADLIITHSSLSDHIAISGLSEKIFIDANWDKIKSAPAPEKAVGSVGSDLAYIIYTSGSTGKPKGVMIGHRNVVRLLRTEKPLFDFKDTDTWTLFHSYCFDFSVWEMFGALLNGGRLVIVPALVTRDPAAFADLLRDEGVTVLNQTPNAFYLLSEELDISFRPLSVRYVIFGGESLNTRKLKNWKKLFPSCRLINMYGITETTVHVTYKEVEDLDIQKGISNIGTAIPTLQCYLLNRHGLLQPVGITGEICVGGEGLARGYWNRKELTDERFVNNPFKPGERLYRSGDLGRWLPDGNIEYLGRMDDQVKIRGFRIEPGEIEQALLSVAGIREALVLARVQSGGMQELVAYFVSEIPVNGPELKRELSGLLPYHMIPAFFVQLERMPLTPNGKVDKKGLPAPEAVGISSDEDFILPRTETESILLKVFQDVLNKDRISIRDNFFDLGGNSIQVARIRIEIKKQLGVQLQVRDLYKYMNIEELAEMSDALRWLQLESAGDTPRQETDHII